MQQFSDFPEDKPLDLRLLIYKYILGYWWLYTLGLGLGVFGAWLRLRYLTPQYVVQSTILIKDPATSGEVASEQMLLQELGLSGSNKSIQNEVQILQSRTLMEEVVRRLKLETSYFAVGRFQDTERYHESPIQMRALDSLGDAASGSFLIAPVDENRFELIEGEKRTIYAYGLPLDLPGGVFSVTRMKQASRSFDTPIRVEFQHPESVAAQYAARLSIKPVETSSVLEISVKDAVPQKAADVLNTLFDVYNEAAIADKNQVAASTLRFIEERLGLLTGELEAVEKGVEQYRRQNNILALEASGASQLIGRMTGVEDDISGIEVQLDLLDMVEEYLRKQKGKFELLPDNLAVGGTSLGTQIGLYNQRILERERLLRSAGERSPALSTMNREILALQDNLFSAIVQMRQELNTTLRAAQSRVGIFEREGRTIPRKERELLEITRQQRIKESLYLYLLEKREQTALSLAISLPSARLIDGARPEGIMVEPRAQLIYLMALFLGLGIPIGIVVLRALLNDRIQSEEDIKNQTNIPIFGTVGLSQSGDNLVIKPNSRSAVAEMFRLLRANLEFAKKGDQGQIILITSSISGEGKSFITLNLGTSLALGNKRTVIIGLDLRKPKLGRYMGRDHSDMGISQYLVGDATTNQILQPSGIHPQLDYISSGPIPPNPSELIQSPRLGELLEYLKARYDYVLLDSPPLGLVSDALLLNRYAQRTLFVVRYNITRKGFLQLVDEQAREEKILHPAIIFNGVRTGRGYGGYAYYGYGYGYGYGYYEEDKSKS